METELSPLEQDLQGLAPELLVEFQKALPVVSQHLSSVELAVWRQEGVTIARRSFRPWDVAQEYFRASQAVAAELSGAAFVAWVRWGRRLVERSPGLASAYFKTSPLVLSLIPAERWEEWAKVARSLYHNNWRSEGLAIRFHEESPKLLKHLPLEGLTQLGQALNALHRKSPDMAAECLSLADGILSKLEPADRTPFLGLMVATAENHWRVAKAYLEGAPGLLARVQSKERERFLTIGEQVARRKAHHIMPFLVDGSRALERLPAPLHPPVLKMTQDLAESSCLAAIEFLRNTPEVLSRIKIHDFPRWYEQGAKTLRENEDAAIAFFRGESTRSQEVLELLSSGVELDRITPILQLYCRALAGKYLRILASGHLVDKGIGWVKPERPSTDGTSVFLPPTMETYETKVENFAAYKVLTTHQTGHLEFGSFEFLLEREAAVFTSLRPHLLRRGEPAEANLPPLVRFFDLFQSRPLASDLFTIVEDARIDSHVKREYGGIRKAYERSQQDSLRRRAPFRGLPLRQAMVELLVHMSLRGGLQVRVPSLVAPQVRWMAWIMQRVQSPKATVEDSAEAALRLYFTLNRIPNLPPDPQWQWEELDLSQVPYDGPDMGPELLTEEGGVWTDELPYGSPEAVDFRGDFKPELVQTIMKLRKDAQEDPDAPFVPMSPEQLRELLERSPDIEIKELTSGDIDSSGMFITNLIKEAGRKQQPLSHQAQRRARRERTNGETPQDGDEGLVFLYDEWDFQAQDYRPNWCLLREKSVELGSVDFFDKTLEENHSLAAQIKRQFEMLRPELFKKIKRLPDGEEFDLDEVIQSLVDKKAGRSPSEKIYWRRNKIERDVSIALLLDMSASTDEDIDGGESRTKDWLDLVGKWDGGWPPRGWLEDRKNMTPYRKIIDVEKESIILLITAMETMGDRYGIFGFSGYGRDNVEFFIIKDLAEQFSDRVKMRLDKVTPKQGTRMGPAIRHATTKLEEHPAKVKILLLLSDGRPQDLGYGRDDTEKEYAIHDTRMALLEARRKHIIPFCLTVDRRGHDYLKAMCEDMGYEVVSDVSSLPERLPTLYKQLAT